MTDIIILLLIGVQFSWDFISTTNQNLFMYAATLGIDDLRGGGIPGDGLGLEGSVAEFEGVSTSESNRESKCSAESQNREIRVSKRRRRKSDIPVVRASIVKTKWRLQRVVIVRVIGLEHQTL